MNFEVVHDQDDGLFEALVAGVRAHNFAHMGEERSQWLAVVVRDEQGKLLGGVAGRTIYRQLLIDVLWVEPTSRGAGLGRQLMALAEAEARQRGCVAAQVDTLSFQAPDFYTRLGFKVIGQVTAITDSPDRYFMLKTY